MAGRVAIVTGASRGLGRAIALTLAAEGAAVAIAARTENEYDVRMPGTVYQTADEIRSAGGTALAVQCDVAVEDDLVRLVSVVERELGAVDLLVNNAALTIPGRPPQTGDTEGESNSPTRVSKQRDIDFMDFPVKGFRRHFDVTLFGPYRLMQLVLSGMIERKFGSIINIGAEAAHHPTEGPYQDSRLLTSFAYGGSKAAMEHLTRSVARSVSSSGVTVNVLIPSLAILTPGVIAGGKRHLDNGTESESDFAQAVVLLALETTESTTGQIRYSQDVLHPELGRRGWLGDPVS
jgi:7-alpha-hydroxysteroid dehydrogenase